MKKQKALLFVTILAFTTLFILAAYSIRWYRLRSGFLDVYDQQIDIPLVNIEDPLPDTRYYYVDHYRIFIYSGEFPTIMVERKILQNRKKIYMTKN